MPATGLLVALDEHGVGRVEKQDLVVQRIVLANIVQRLGQRREKLPAAEVDDELIVDDTMSF